jgi:heme exporter protein C
MMLATKFYYVASLFGRVRTDLLALESGKDWVRQIAEAQGPASAGRARAATQEDHL